MESPITHEARRFILFLEEARTMDAILSNEDFLAIAAYLHLQQEDRRKAAYHFNWVSVRALPEPAVLNFISEKGMKHRHRK